MIRLPLAINFSRTDRLTVEEFYIFCRDNGDLQIERQADGTITIMSPESLTSGRANSYLLYCLYGWKMKTNLGEVFGSSTGFTLPDGSVLSPDACWVSWDRMSHVSKADMKRFSRVCPDFVVEVLSPSDSMKATEQKMRNWIANGARLGWLIDPSKKKIKIFRPDTAMEVLKAFDQTLLAGDEMPGFAFNLLELRAMMA